MAVAKINPLAEIHELPIKSQNNITILRRGNKEFQTAFPDTIPSAFQAKTGQLGKHKKSSLESTEFTAEFMAFPCNAKTSAGALQVD